MRKFIPVLILAATPALGYSASPEDVYFNKQNPALTAQERAAMAVADKWKASGAGTVGVAPGYGQNGVVKFAYGSQQPSIVCAVLQLCDLALQPGEQVNSLNIGDAARWSIEPAISGSGDGEVQHLIIKPLDVGLETSLSVTTNRRVYHIRLRSHRTQYMPQVAFTYPEDSVAKWKAVRAAEVRDRREKTMPETGEYLGNLSFDYEVRGSASWKPLRVYNDGRKTIIQMPSSMAQTEAPTLLVVRKEGGLFTDDETVMVNYRVQDDRYIVDTLFDKAIMIAGVGSDQDRVVIQKGK